MTPRTHHARFGAFLMVALLALPVAAADEKLAVEEEKRVPCTEDAMIVFDASGSMAGNMVQGLFSATTRIDEVRKALGHVLPGVTKFRKVGLITYGPGHYQQCNVQLDLPPSPNAAKRIMSVVNVLNPAGKTPLVEGVEQAAKVLDHRREQGVVVLLTDGEETCGGSPCALGKALKLHSRDLTVHVVGFQMRGYMWTTMESFQEVRCLAKETGGLYITAQNRADLIEAFEQTLGCPMMSRLEQPLTSLTR